MHKVLGYYGKGVERNSYFLSVQGGLITMESPEAIRKHLQEIGNNNFYSIKKIRGTDIFRAFEENRAVSFNRHTYSKFYPLAIKQGLDLEPIDNMPFEQQENDGSPFVTILP